LRGFLTDKGKPAARQGRKAKGSSISKAAWPPILSKHT